MRVSRKKEIECISGFEGKRKRRFLTAEKKFQIFLEWQSGKTRVDELLEREGIYCADLAQICQKVREGAVERLADPCGAKKKTAAGEDYEALKRELEVKERALTELAAELGILRKKRMEVRG